MNAMEWGCLCVSAMGMAMLAVSLQRMARVQKVWSKSGRPGMGGDMVVAFVEVMIPKSFANPAFPSDARMLLSASASPSAMALFCWAAMLLWFIPECVAWSGWAGGQSLFRGMMLPNMLGAVGMGPKEVGPVVDALLLIPSLSAELLLPAIAVVMGRRCESRLASLRELGTPMAEGFAKAYEQEAGKRETLASAKAIEAALGPAVDLKGSRSSRRL